MRAMEPAKMKPVRFSGVRVIMAEAAKLEAHGIDVVHFDIGQPDFPTPPHVIAAARKAMEAGKTDGYTAVPGLPTLRKACANRLNEELGVSEYKAENIIITCGGQEAIAMAMSGLMDPGDEILLPSPCYLAYPNMAYLANAAPVMVPLNEADNWDLDTEAMEASITPKTKILLLCSPNNPTGNVLSDDCLARIADICIRHDLLVISDEAYEKIIFDGRKFRSIASLPGMQERTVVVRTFSKSDAMCGWRIGYAATSDALVSMVFRAHNFTVTHASSIGQYAALEAITGPVDTRDAMVAEFARRRDYVTGRLKEMGIPFCMPQGAFYLFPNVSSLGMDGREFCTRLLQEAHVTVVPGDVFGEEGRYNIRISYATDMERCIEGMRRMEIFVNKVKGN